MQQFFIFFQHVKVYLLILEIKPSIPVRLNNQLIVLLVVIFGRHLNFYLDFVEMGIQIHPPVLLLRVLGRHITEHTNMFWCKRAPETRTASGIPINHGFFLFLCLVIQIWISKFATLVSPRRFDDLNSL